MDGRKIPMCPRDEDDFVAEEDEPGRLVALQVVPRVLSRIAADDLMVAYDDAVSAYRLAVRLGVEAGPAFAKWNEERERLIDSLCREAS